MKKVLTLMLGLVASAASFAHSPITRPSSPQTHLVMTTDHKIKLYVQPLQTKGKLAIRDANGQTIYNSTVSLQKGLSQQFDFSGLSMGKYELTLTTDKETLTRSFVVQASPDESFIIQES